MRKLIFALALCGCASQGVPPGGPPDTEAPKLIAITPDSGATAVKRGIATFRFDEVVSEKPPAATTLGDLFIVSPRQGVPDVSWHRQEIRVKMRRGWLPNTTYTITLLPGLADLRGNVKNTGSSTFFSTGAAIDKAIMKGTVYDLLTGTPVRGAVVEARTGTDTTVSWVAVADTSGAFRLEHLPPRTFLVRAYQDKNRNFGVDPGEASDTSAVAAGDSSTANFFIVVRDSIAPRITAALAVDSVTLNVAFDRPSDSASAVNPGAYSIIGTDSTVIPVRSVSLPPRDTTHRRPTGARAMPVGAVTIALGSPLAAKKSYLLRAVGIRGLLGQTAPSEIRVTLTPPPSAPVRPPPPSNLPGGAVPIPIKHD